MVILWTLVWGFSLFVYAYSLPVNLLYEHSSATHLPKQDDVSSREIPLIVPIAFYDEQYSTIFVNSNGLLSFQTEIPNFFNIEFPLDYPIIAPFYSNVDTSEAGNITYYETDDSVLLKRAGNNVHSSFSDSEDFRPLSLFVVTWSGVGYHKNGSDKVNTFQVAIISDGEESFVEFLYPQNGIQWIQGTGDESGLPDARAQAGFISVDGKFLTLPGSGTPLVQNIEKWSNMDIPGQWIYRIGPIVPEENIEEPDMNNKGIADIVMPKTCEKGYTQCHTHAKCNDYNEGFCCQCKPNYYGNGKNCIKRDVPLRVNGRISGKINGEPFETLDLQSYVVMIDGRAYTGISRIPQRIGFDIQSLQILGGVIGWLFAKPTRTALNGYQLTGGYFNHSAIITFPNTSLHFAIRQKYLGLDVYDQLRLETELQGDLPRLPLETNINIDEYNEEYTLTKPGVIQSSSSHHFTYTNAENVEEVIYYTVEQSFSYDYCKHEPQPTGTTWKLRVGKNFIKYENVEQIVRFGISNKVVPLGEFDPCEEGKLQCGENSACVVDGESFRCVCNPGFQYIYSDDRQICIDVNECELEIDDCDFNAKCINEAGSFSCTCNPAFTGNGRVCEEAATCNGVSCPENSECVLEGVARCRCLPGFTGNGLSCKALQALSCHIANNCSPFAYCFINPDTNLYSCNCLPDYEGDGYTCEVKFKEDLASCHIANDCSPNGFCSVNPDTRLYSCICLPDFVGDGYTCEEQIQETTEVQETTTSNLPADHVIARCLLVTCWCPTGYKMLLGTKYCIPDEESVTAATTEETTPEAGDRPQLQCYNSSLCFCPKGFYLNSTSKECVLSSSFSETKGLSSNFSCHTLNDCHMNAQCVSTSTLGSYKCACNPGYEGDGYSCKEVEVSCSQSDICDPHATCKFAEHLNKSVCICNQGYHGDGTTCDVIALCASDRDCSQNEVCTYIKSSQNQECVCKDGFIRDSQHQCVSLKGNCGGGTCVDNAECLYDEEYETHYCTCKADFIGDGITECKPRPLGCNDLNNCGLHADCVYDYSSYIYTCKCREGFYGDGFVCYTERNCHVDPSMCHKFAVCTTDADRRYSCRCGQGYSGNGSFCFLTPKHEGNFLLLNQGMATLKIPHDEAQNKHGRPVQMKSSQISVALDVDCFGGRMYWGDINGKAIRSAAYNGGNKSDFITKNITSPEGLSIDWVSRNIYWTDSTKHTIEVANIETRLRKTLFSTGLTNPRGIAVHPMRGKIFWSDWDRKQPRIEWANSDGTGREIFLQAPHVHLPNSLTIDYDLEQVCYTDAGSKSVECVEIDTKQRHTMAINCTYPFGVAVTNRHVYYSDWISKKIERIEKHSRTRLKPLNVPLVGNSNKLYEIVAVPDQCPNLTNVCHYYKDQCPSGYICLPNGTGSRKCVCGQKIDSPGENPVCNDI